MAERDFGHGPDGHVDVDVVSDLVEGLLTDEQAASVLGHLESCPECAEVHAALVEMRDLLRTADPVGPMPTAVVERLNGTIAEEHRRRAAKTADAYAPSAAATPAGANVTSLDAARARRRRRPAVLSAAAGIVAVVVAGVVALSVSLGGGSSPNPGPGGPSAPGELGHPVPVTQYSDSGTDYTSADLGNQVQAVLRADGLQVGTPTGAPAALPTLSPSGLPGCVTAGITQKAKPPLAVDKGTFDGQPAYVVAFQDTDGPVADVFVLDGTCSAGPSTPAAVFASQRVFKP